MNLAVFGAGMGTRTPTPEAREPKSRMSTNSIMPAYEDLLANHTTPQRGLSIVRKGIDKSRGTVMICMI